MRRVAIVLLAVAAAVMLSNAAYATTSCFLFTQVNPTTQQWVIQATNGNINFIGNLVSNNVQINSETCGAAVNTASSCGFEIQQMAPGPVSFQVDAGDGDGVATCGPITNADGLPVELVEFSVE